MLWLVLITAVWNLIRIWGGLAFWGGIQEYAAWPGAVYVIVTGGLWALCGLVTLLAFWRRAEWADEALLLQRPGLRGVAVGGSAGDAASSRPPIGRSRF